MNRSLKIELPEYYNFAVDVVDAWSTFDPNHVALTWVDENFKSTQNFTFRHLSTESTKMANFFLSHGINKGDIVMLMLPRIPLWWVCVLGLIKIGAVASPSTTSLQTRDIQYRCNATHVKMVVTYPDAVLRVEAMEGILPLLVTCGDIPSLPTKQPWIPLSHYNQYPPILPSLPPTHSSDPLILYFTSGTTGFPKMVLHRQSYALAHRYTGEVWHTLGPRDIIYSISDTGWAKAAYSMIFGQWHVGSRVLIYNMDKFVPQDVLRLLEVFKVTVFCAPPTAYRKLILEDFKSYNLGHLRHFTSSGEPLNPEVAHKWQEATHLPIYEGYGQTETTLLICTTPGMTLKPGSMGKALPYVNVTVLDDKLQPCEVGVEGTIAVSMLPNPPLGLFLEYGGVEAKQKNKEVFREGWYLTGDRAKLDKDGYFWFVSRGDDIIKTSGYRVGPFEIESTLLTHPAIVEAAVVGIPHPIRGQVIKTFVTVKPEYHPKICDSTILKSQILEFCKNHLIRYQVPSFIEIVDELPKTVSGKIRRNELREMEVRKSQQTSSL